MNLRKSTKEATYASSKTTVLPTCDFCCFPVVNLSVHIKSHDFPSLSAAKLISTNPAKLAEWKSNHGYTSHAGECGICRKIINKRSLKRHIQHCFEVGYESLPELEEAPVVKFSALTPAKDKQTPSKEPTKKRRKRLNRFKPTIANITKALDDLPDSESDQDSSVLESSEEES